MLLYTAQAYIPCDIEVHRILCHLTLKALCFLPENHHGCVMPRCVAGDVAALDEHLHKIGVVEALHSVFPPGDPDAKVSDADKAVVLPKLLSHARLHLLYVAEKLQEHLVSSEAQGTSSSSKVCCFADTMLVAQFVQIVTTCSLF